MRHFWFMFYLFGFHFDLDDEIIIDCCALTFGTKYGPKFSGSLFMFYYETAACRHDPAERRWDWDFLYLKQLFD